MTTKKTKSVFDTLSSINVNNKVEKKNNLKYLPWAWAWGIVKTTYPDTNYEVDLYDEKPYLYDENLGYMVSTKVCINGECIAMQLPIMDGANKAMKSKAYEYTTRYGKKKVEAATMFDINTAIMRCLTKNLAMFGLGHYIYGGEDVPGAEKKQLPKPKITPLNVGDDNWNKVLKYVQANKKLGAAMIIKNLGIKYTMATTVKTQITKLISQ